MIHIGAESHENTERGVTEPEPCGRWRAVVVTTNLPRTSIPSSGSRLRSPSRARRLIWTQLAVTPCALTIKATVPLFEVGQF